MQVSATVSSSSCISLDAPLVCEESVEAHGGDFGKVYKHLYQLDNENKYSLLKQPFVPHISFEFPATTDEYGKKENFSTHGLILFLV